MIDRFKDTVIPDNEYFFREGFVYVIYRNRRGDIKVKQFILHEWSKPISLRYLASRYPYMILLIHESALSGEVFRYMNHPGDGEDFEITGHTHGYA